MPSKRQKGGKIVEGGREVYVNTTGSTVKITKEFRDQYDAARRPSRGGMPVIPEWQEWWAAQMAKREEQE